MEEITINDLQGLWLGNEFNIFIGRQGNPNYGNLVNILDKINIVTYNIELSDVTEDNTRMLVFNEEFSIEIWGWYTTEMTLTIDNARYDVVLRPDNNV